MPNVNQDIKLDFKDVLLRPKRSKIKSRADVSQSICINLRFVPVNIHKSNIFREIEMEKIAYQFPGKEFQPFLATFFQMKISGNFFLFFREFVLDKTG